MVDDVLLNKGAQVERAVKRVQELHGGDEASLSNRTRQEAILLNLHRACENSIDGAMHLVRVHRLGIPQKTLEAFDMLERATLIDPQLAERLKALVTYRQDFIHDDAVDVVRLQAFVVEGPEVLLSFATLLLRQGVDIAGTAR